MSRDITHQNHAAYQAKKILDLTRVPDETWQRVRKVRLSAQFMVRDYSWHDGETNGLDEAFEVVVNGHVHRYATNCGAPVMEEGKPPGMDWYELAVPREEFTKGLNEIILRKAPSDKNDDYLYLAIDLTQRRGNSYVTFDGQTWTQDKLTVPGGNGEYMVRLYLFTRDPALRAVWRPGRKPDLDDPAGLIVYRGSRTGKAEAAGLLLREGDEARIEWPAGALDALAPLRVTVEASAETTVSWLDEAGAPTQATRLTAGAGTDLSAGRSLKPSGVRIAPAGDEVTVQAVVLEGEVSHRPGQTRIDMCPRMAKPAGRPTNRKPTCAVAGDSLRLRNRSLRCEFGAGERLRLRSLYNEYTASEMVRDAAQVNLFLLDVDGRRFSGSRDFRCESIEARGHGFRARLSLPEPSLEAVLDVDIEDEGLRLGLAVRNAGRAAVDFKLAFPHLAGLAVSGQPADDYYFYPLGGGIIADRPALIRGGYGDHVALYQLMSLFSPERGGGLYVRVDDRDGRFKTLSLRKVVPGQAELLEDRTNITPTTDEFRWADPLQAVPGTSLACEYLRRTRQPGDSFAPAPVVLASHSGDWRAAMRAYADWAHRVWEFRRCPSALHDVVNMIAAGWGQGYLFRDGKYRTDIIRPLTDCIELMSWWDWSPFGPWRTPFDRLDEVLSEAQIERWRPYFVEDPVTGETMWNNQPGDYDGYNERFGGLPAFRRAIETYRDLGALVTLYTDPFRLDDGSKTGQGYGERWGVVLPSGEHSKAYDVWNPCHDLPEVRGWVADTMERVLAETGADGIRLDEYGHRGWACFSKEHEHTFAEWGCTEWQRATAAATRMVRAAMDEVNPDSVLTTEHPGCDYLMQFLEGCITYDLTVQASQLRPLECNLQRFYFPECKAYELDHRRAGPEHRKRFWNGVASFGSYYPANMHRILQENRDVFGSRDTEPLVPSLAQYVYVNRFSGAGKTLYHVYNGTGHTFHGPALGLALRGNEHVFDMLASRPAEVQRAGSRQHVRIYLERDEVACLAVLRRRLRVTTEGEQMVVDARVPPGDCVLAVCDTDGAPLLSRKAEQGRNVVNLSELHEDATPASVKLMRNTLLLDVASLTAP